MRIPACGKKLPFAFLRKSILLRTNHHQNGGLPLMRIERILALTLAGVMTASLLTGCPQQQGGPDSSPSSSSSSRPHHTGSDDSSGDDTSSSSSSSEPEETPPEEGFTVDAAGTYHVYNEKGLRAWARNPNTNCTLENNIELEGEWTPIGSSQDRYTGIFDGQGHAIKGLKVTLGKDSERAGLFAYIGTNGCVQNLRLEAPSISGSTAGGIAAVIDGGKVTGCTVTGATIQVGNMNVGGIAGTVMSNSAITGCVVSGSTISGGEGSSAGGLVGSVQGTRNTFTACCVVNGEVTTGNDSCGGMFGNINWVEYITVTACYWSGNAAKGVGEASQGQTPQPNWESDDIHEVNDTTTWNTAVEEMNKTLPAGYSYSYAGGTVKLHMPGAGAQSITLANPFARFIFEDLGL